VQSLTPPPPLQQPSCGNRLADRTLRHIWHVLKRRLTGKSRLREFDDAHPCVFVLSTGRAGTQTLASLLGLARSCLAYHEPAPTLWRLAQMAYESGGDSSMAEILDEGFLAGRKVLLNHSLACSKGYVETGPHLTFLARQVRAILPEATFIHLVRDPRAVVRSAMRRDWYSGHPYDCWRIRPRPDTPMAERWEASSPFQKNLWLWKETNDGILDFTTTLPAGRLIRVRAEDVFKAHEDTLNALFLHLSTVLPSERRIRRVLGKRLNAQRSGTFPQPSGWSEDMIRELQEVTGATARLCGYDL
jgi:sulfotransferase family protein